MKKHCFAIFGTLLLLAGCVSAPTRDIQVETDVDPKINLGGYSSYTWLGSAAIVYDPDGKWEPPQFDADAEIRFLIDRELREHGMTESSADPDLIVAFAAGIDMDSMDIEIDPESELEVLSNVPRGALAVILIDASSAKAIWAGVAVAEIQQEPEQDVIKKRLDYAVSKMFNKLPK